jgi:anti-sigma-K factor RskA
MSGHPQFEEDLALYALGALERGSCAVLEGHLAECAECRRELERLQGDAALLALSVAGASPPQAARARLMQAVGREPHPRAVPMRRRWWALAPVFSTAVLALFGILLWQENAVLKDQMEEMRAQVEQGQRESRRAREILAVMMAPDAAHFTLVAAESKPQPQGKAIYVMGKGCVFFASNLAPLPAAKAYELWLVPTAGAPIPVGVFKPDARGSATLLGQQYPAHVPAKAFAITIEPEGGSQTPTPPIVLAGAGQ